MTLALALAESLIDLPTDARTQAAAENFSIDDYGRDEGVYQVVVPSYPAPKFLRQYNYLAQALRECDTMCRLEGKPFRAVRWGREGSGAAGGVPCKACCPKPPGSKFPHTPLYSSCSCLEGFPNLKSIAEFQPGGRRIVFGGRGCCNGRIVGAPNYVVAHTPFVRTYVPEQQRVRYQQGMAALMKIANSSGKRTFLCSGLLADCRTRDPKLWTPVVYVDPGSYAPRYVYTKGNEVHASPMNAAQFREYVAMADGRSTLPIGA